MNIQALQTQIPFQDIISARPLSSPNGGPISARNDLSARFRDRIFVNEALSRKLVSYQGNKAVAGLRWMKYKEGFSSQLVASLLDCVPESTVLDPFSGIGTTALTASARKMSATGIEIKSLRQALLSATVENHSKRKKLQDDYGKSSLPKRAFALVDQQDALDEALTILREHADELGNRHVIRLLENYFAEMAVIICELERLLKPGGNVFMVNDNVRYHGEEIPVDLILSDFAEQSGFECKAIWTLKRGKGNSSQQMGRFGRQEIRKCVYHWVRGNGPPNEANALGRVFHISRGDAQQGIINPSFSTPRSLALLTLAQHPVQAHLRIGKD